MSETEKYYSGLTTNDASVTEGPNIKRIALLSSLLLVLLGVFIAMITCSCIYFRNGKKRLQEAKEKAILWRLQQKLNGTRTLSQKTNHMSLFCVEKEISILNDIPPEDKMNKTRELLDCNFNLNANYKSSIKNSSEYTKYNAEVNMEIDAELKKVMNKPPKKRGHKRKSKKQDDLDDPNNLEKVLKSFNNEVAKLDELKEKTSPKNAKPSNEIKKKQKISHIPTPVKNESTLNDTRSNHKNSENHSNRRNQNSSSSRRSSLSKNPPTQNCTDENKLQKPHPRRRHHSEEGSRLSSHGHHQKQSHRHHHKRPHSSTSNKPHSKEPHDESSLKLYNNYLETKLKSSDSKPDIRNKNSNLNENDIESKHISSKRQSSRSSKLVENNDSKKHFESDLKYTNKILDENILYSSYDLKDDFSVEDSLDRALLEIAFPV